MYSVFKQLGNGEFVQVASRDKLEEAVQLVNGLGSEWPGEYEVRESHFQTVRYAIKLSIDRDVKLEIAT